MNVTRECLEIIESFKDKLSDAEYKETLERLQKCYLSNEVKCKIFKVWYRLPLFTSNLEFDESCCTCNGGCVGLSYTDKQVATVIFTKGEVQKICFDHFDPKIFLYKLPREVAKIPMGCIRCTLEGQTVNINRTPVIVDFKEIKLENNDKINVVDTESESEDTDDD